MSKYEYFFNHKTNNLQLYHIIFLNSILNLSEVTEKLIHLIITILIAHMLSQTFKI